MGTVRVGVAASDPDGLLATPVKTLKRDARRGSDLRALARLAAERSAVRVYVGLPRSLRGGDTESTRMARAYAGELAGVLAAEGVAAEVRLVDERLTTVTAHRALSEAGMDRRSHRDVVDQAAATDILQHALNMQTSRGDDVGSPVPSAGTQAATEPKDSST